MKRIAKYLAVAALVLALLLAAGGWYLNHWLQSPEAHATIEGKISESVRLPVKIGTLRFSVWSGITAKKISVSGPDGPLFEAAGMSAGHSFSGLLHGSIALSEVRIEQPHFRLVQDASGRWGMPAAAAPPPAPAEPPKVQSPTSAPAAASAPAKPPNFSIGQIVIENGTAELIDKAHAPFASITGMNVTLRDVSAAGFAGSFSTDHVILHGWCSLDHLGGLVTQTGPEFQVRKLAAEAGGGSITGEATWTAGAASASLKLENVNLDRAAQNAGASARKIAGTLGGDVQFTSLGAGTNALAGTGEFTLKGGDCTQFDVLRQIGDGLRVVELANFKIADATARFKIENGQAILGPMEISAAPAGLTLSGSIGFDGTLNLTGLLHLPANLVDRQGAMLAARFTPPDASGQRRLPFAITGTLTKPRQNLAESLTGTKNRDEQRVIGAATALSTILEKTNLGKKNPKLMKLLPQLVPARPTPQPAPPPAPAQP